MGGRGGTQNANSGYFNVGRSDVAETGSEDDGILILSSAVLSREVTFRYRETDVETPASCDVRTYVVFT